PALPEQPDVQAEFGRHHRCQQSRGRRFSEAVPVRGRIAGPALGSPDPSPVGHAGEKGTSPLKTWLFPVTFISATVGLLMAVQFKSQASYRQDIPSRRPEELVVLVKDAELEKKRLSNQVDALLKQVKDAQVNPAHTKPVLPARWGALEGP